MANLAAFYETRKCFMELTQWTKQLSYDEWMNSPRDHKSALLFVNFFSKMIQAWDKANRFDFIDGEDGVSTVLQYLEKNVSKIEAEPNKYSEAYIYKVAYNCMYCICHDLKSVQDRWDNETSSIVSHDGEEFNLFDSCTDGSGSAEDSALLAQEQKQFWELVESSDPKCQKVIDYLLSNDIKKLKKTPKHSKMYAIDPLRDVKVSIEEADLIIAEIKDRLEAIELADQVCERSKTILELKERAEIDRLLNEIRNRIENISYAQSRIG